MIESDSNAVAGDYLERLAQETDVRSARRALLASDIDAQGLEALHGRLGGHEPPPDDPAAVSVGARLSLAYSARPLAPPEVLTTDAHGITRLRTAPPLARTPLAPEPWAANPFVRYAQRTRDWIGRGFRRRHKARQESPTPRWQKVGMWRRKVLLLLVVGQSLVAAEYMRSVLP